MRIYDLIAGGAVQLPKPVVGESKCQTSMQSFHWARPMTLAKGLSKYPASLVQLTSRATTGPQSVIMVRRAGRAVERLQLKRIQASSQVPTAAPSPMDARHKKPMAISVAFLPKAAYQRLKNTGAHTRGTGRANLPRLMLKTWLVRTCASHNLLYNLPFKKRYDCCDALHALSPAHKAPCSKAPASKQWPAKIECNTRKAYAGSAQCPHR